MRSTPKRAATSAVISAFNSLFEMQTLPEWFGKFFDQLSTFNSLLDILN